MVEHTEGYNFSLKGKRKTKFQLVKPGAQLSINEGLATGLSRLDPDTSVTA